MIPHHLVLDTPSLATLPGHRQASTLIHRASIETDTQLWTPVLSVLEADHAHPGLAEHIGQLDIVPTIDLDHPAVLAVAQLHRDGVPPGVSAAIHAARHPPARGTDTLIATVDPKAYEGQGVPAFDLNR